MHRRCASFPKQKALLAKCFLFWRLRPGIRLWRRYARLPLTSELDALCAAYVNRTPLRQGARNRFKSKAYTAKRKNRGHHTGVLYFLEVQAGFEPADNGVADRGLTTWLLHQMFSYCNIIAKIFHFVKGGRSFLQKRFQKILKKIVPVINAHKKFWID